MKRAMKAAAMKAMKAMKVMRKKAAMKRAMKAAAPAAPMKAMKVMKKKAAMKRAMKAAAPMKAMKAMKKKAVIAMSKGGIADALAAKCGLKKAECSKVLDDFAALATTEVKKTGKFTIPGLCMLKTRIRPARKAGTAQAFGKTIKVKARAAKTIVKAFCVSALKKSV